MFGQAAKCNDRYPKNSVFNPSSPDINVHVLLITLYIFLIVLVERICLKIKTFCLW